MSLWLCVINSTTCQARVATGLCSMQKGCRNQSLLFVSMGVEVLVYSYRPKWWICLCHPPSMVDSNVEILGKKTPVKQMRMDLFQNEWTYKMKLKIRSHLTCLGKNRHETVRNWRLQNLRLIEHKQKSAENVTLWFEAANLHLAVKPCEWHVNNALLCIPQKEMLQNYSLPRIYNCSNYLV